MADTALVPAVTTTDERAFLALVDYMKSEWYRLDIFAVKTVSGHITTYTLWAKRTLTGGTTPTLAATSAKAKAFLDAFALIKAYPKLRTLD